MEYQFEEMLSFDKEMLRLVALQFYDWNVWQEMLTK
jgi:hypothetical protein